MRLALLLFFLAYSQSFMDIEKRFLDKISGEKQQRPVLVLIGGFEGSGKTTLSNALRARHPLLVVSTDEIRQEIINHKIALSPQTEEFVRRLRDAMVEKALLSGLHVLLDANAYDDRVKDYQRRWPEYRIIKICLLPSEETLFKRVRMREKREGVHHGTEESLMKSLAQKKIHPENYDLVIKTDEVPFSEELTLVEGRLKLE